MSENEQWIQRGQGTVIAFLHGIGAKAPQDYWEQFLNVLQSDEQMREFGIFVWKYPTHKEPTLLKDKPLVSDAAPRIKLLGEAWGAVYRAQFRDYQEVILVCHSMGGLVVKSWVVGVLLDGDSAKLETLRHITFYATPHNGALSATLTAWNEQLRDMKLDSAFIADVGKGWHDRVVAWKDQDPGLSDHLYNRYIPHLVIAGLNDKVVPYNLATIRGMETMVVQGDHSQVIQPANVDDTRYKAWQDDVEETLRVKPRTIPFSSETAQHAMNRQGGIYVRRIDAENVVSGIQIQGGDAQSAAALVQLAQSIRRGDIRADELKARHLVSGLQYIADPSQASVEDLRRELAALRTKLEQAIAAQEIADAADADDAQESLTTAETELAKPQPNGGRVLRKLDALSQIVTRSAEAAEAAGKLGAIVIQLAPLAATLWQVAQKLLGG